MRNDPPPEKIPLRHTIWYVLLSDIFLVQLFSNSQQLVARITNREPSENWKLPCPSKVSKILERVINPIAIHNLLVTVSLNSNNAINVVATISKFPNKDAFAAVPILIPIIKKIGAAISNTIIPRTYSQSSHPILSSTFSFLYWNKYMAPTPIPAPKYKNATINVGDTLSSKIFENGVFIA